MSSQTIIYAVPVFGALALLYTWIKSGWVSKQDVGTEKMAKIAKHIADGAMSFLKAEYKVLGYFVVAVAALMAWSGTTDAATTSPLVALSFVLGAICSALAGYIGMKVDSQEEQLWDLVLLDLEYLVSVSFSLFILSHSVFLAKLRS